MKLYDFSEKRMSRCSQKNLSRSLWIICRQKSEQIDAHFFLPSILIKIRSRIAGVRQINEFDLTKSEDCKAVKALRINFVITILEGFHYVDSDV